MLAGACCVRMLEHVAAAIDARALAVPHRKDAVVLGAFVHVDLLCPPYRGRRKVFVHPRLKAHVAPFEMLFSAHGSLIDAAEG